MKTIRNQRGLFSHPKITRFIERKTGMKLYRYKSMMDELVYVLISIAYVYFIWPSGVSNGELLIGIIGALLMQKSLLKNG